MINVSTLLCFLSFLCYTKLLVQGQEQEEVPYETIYQGSYSGITDELMTVYRNNDEYNAFFLRHNSDQSPVPIPPILNFVDDNLLIAALYMGTENSGGYSVNITNVYLQNEEVIIEYITREPGQYDGVTSALTQPHHVIQIELPSSVNQQNINYQFQQMELVETMKEIQYVITFDADADSNTVIQTIQEGLYQYILNVQLLSAINIGIINFDASVINEETGQELLSNIDGVQTVELDTIVYDDMPGNNAVTAGESVSTMTMTIEENAEEEKGEEVSSPLRFILTVDENTDLSSVEENISNSSLDDMISGIQLLSAVRMLFVDFDETEMENNDITKSDIQLQLQNIDGVNTVEEDGIVSINDDMNNSVQMVEEDESSSFSLSSRMVSSLLIAVIAVVHVL